MKHQNKSLWQLLLITPVIVLIFCTISTASAQTVPEIAEKALAATVYLEMQDSNGKTLGFGSGFFVKPNLIATNYHVIAGHPAAPQSWSVNIPPIKLKVLPQPTRPTISCS